MSETDQTGGPAFPSQQHLERDEKWNQTYVEGMSIADYFAAHATEADIAIWILDGPDNVGTLLHKVGIRDRADAQYTGADYARLRSWARYQHAAAMIAERQKDRP